jgi:hypothetical protein
MARRGDRESTRLEQTLRRQPRPSAFAKADRGLAFQLWFWRRWGNLGLAESSHRTDRHLDLDRAPPPPFGLILQLDNPQSQLLDRSWLGSHL